MIPKEFYNDFLNRGLPVKDKNMGDITLELTGSFPTETVIVRTCQIWIMFSFFFHLTCAMFWQNRMPADAQYLESGLRLDVRYFLDLDIPRGIRKPIIIQLLTLLFRRAS